MQPCLAITPSGHLRVEDGPATQPPIPETTAALLRGAFAQSSADGLLVLATRELDQEVPADFVFWRGVARDLFQHVCHLGEAPVEQWTALKVPPDEELSRL